MMQIRAREHLDIASPITSVVFRTVKQTSTCDLLAVTPGCE